MMQQEKSDDGAAAVLLSEAAPAGLKAVAPAEHMLCVAAQRFDAVRGHLAVVLVASGELVEKRVRDIKSWFEDNRRGARRLARRDQRVRARARKQQRSTFASFGEEKEKKSGRQSGGGF